MQLRESKLKKRSDSEANDAKDGGMTAKGCKRYRAIARHPFEFLFVFGTAVLLLYRIASHADIYDEIFNITVSYRVAIGQLPYYQCWEAYQGGDLILAPIIKLFLFVTGGKTSGMILFCRLVYIAAQLICAMVVARTLRTVLNKNIAFLVGYSCLFFNLYGLYYPWYDSVCVTLFLLGLFLLYGALAGAYSGRGRVVALVAGGLCHGLMILSYPTFLYVVLGLLALLTARAVRRRDGAVFGYVVGGLAIALLGVFIAFFVIGFDHLLFGIQTILSYRSIAQNSSRFFLVDLLVAYFTVNPAYIIISVILAVAFKVALVDKDKPLVFGILLVTIPAINLRLIDYTYAGLLNYASYIGLWGCALFVFLYRNHRDTIEWDRIVALFLYIWMPSILSCIATSASTVYASIGPIKGWQSTFPAALVTLALLLISARNEDHSGQIGTSQDFRSCEAGDHAPLPVLSVGAQIIPVVFSTVLLLNSFYYVYLKAPRLGIDAYRMPHGIYKGIQVDENMRAWSSVPAMLKKYEGGRETVLVSGSLRPIYLMSSLTPFTPSVEGPDYYIDKQLCWDMSIKYFEYFKEYPDVMYLTSEDIQNDDIKAILSDMYESPHNEKIGSHKILVYLKK